MTQDTRERIIVPGPAGFHPPSAAQLGVALPDPGEGLYYGLLEPNEDIVIEEMARKMLTSPNATIFPGPLVLWAWNNHAVEKAKAVLEIAAQIPEVMIIPMPDYRPKYPKIDPEEVINPNHPNLTIWGNKIEACNFGLTILLQRRQPFSHDVLTANPAITDCSSDDPFAQLTRGDFGFWQFRHRAFSRWQREPTEGKLRHGAEAKCNSDLR